MVIERIGKRKFGTTNSNNVTNKKKKLDKYGVSAVKPSKITKPLDQLNTIGQIVFRSAHVNIIDTTKSQLHTVWNYSVREDLGLEEADLRIMTNDNELVFMKHATQSCDQDHPDGVVQESGNDQQKLFIHLSRLCMNNFVSITNTSLDTNTERSLATLTLAADTEKKSVLKQLFLWVIPYLYPTTSSAHDSYDGAISIDDFYRHLQPPISKHLLSKCHGPGLQTALTPYQSQNVEWMLHREGYSILDDGTLQENTANQLPYLWEKVAVTHTGSQHIYINRITQHIFSSWCPELEKKQQKMYRGGILADEMGLGKTVSTIALIALHSPHNSNAYQHINIPGLKKTGATLIIVPPTIIHQWESEFKRHAPDLRVTFYPGIKNVPYFVESSNMVDNLSSSDVVLTSYDVLKSEIYYARDIPERSRRRNTDLKPKRSPLIQILWWRCIVDEAQQVESNFAKATEMARLIPRHYSWAVTGTPIKSTNYADLHGLLRFLEHQDNMSAVDYKRFYTSSALRQLFLDFTKRIIRRNMKSLLLDQIHIPAQHRNVINISFSAIEQQYYNDLRQLTAGKANEGWLDSIGWEKPKDTSSPDFKKFVESTRALRKWLYALRETCVYPARIGKGNQDVQSLGHVLNIMIQKTLDNIDDAEIGLANDKLTYGGMHELLQEDWKSPLSIYLDWMQHVEEKLKVCSGKLDEAKRLNQSNVANNSKNGDQHESNVKAVQPLQITFTTWQNILHRYYFYTAGVYHMLEDSDKENTYYEMAADVRRQILARPQERVDASVNEIKNMDSNLALRNLMISLRPQKATLLLTDDFLTRVDKLVKILNNQMEVILEWRAVLKQILTSNLVDSNEGDVQGDEYIDSVTIQKKCYMYQDMYQDILRDRYYWINGVWQTSRATNNKDDTNITDNTEEEELTELREKLVKRRQALAPKFVGSNNLRNLVAEISEIASGSNVSHKVENHLIQQELNHLGREIKQQKEVQDILELEYRKLSALSNHRIEYYRYLQQISDHVETWESPNPQQAIETLELQMKSHENTIREQYSRLRYLENIATEEQESTNGANNEKVLFCLICKENFTRGLVTHCGHVYCKVCAEIWFKTSRRCPQCSATVKDDERYPIFSSVATLQQDSTDKSVRPSSAASSSGLSNDTLLEISRVPIEAGLGAKLDSVIRHIKYIQQENNGKCLVFSQWNRLLEILGNGLRRNGIGYVSLLAKKHGDSIERFRSDSSTNVMLLHSRSHSSGLTLVEAKTVFILEPVLTESLEKQAIGRVHRIGQTDETSVFWYIVRDTIEEKIQSIHNEKQRHRQITNDIELETISKPVLVANTEGGGEYVTDEDLRKCFSKLE